MEASKWLRLVLEPNVVAAVLGEDASSGPVLPGLKEALRAVVSTYQPLIASRVFNMHATLHAGALRQSRGKDGAARAAASGQAASHDGPAQPSTLDSPTRAGDTRTDTDTDMAQQAAAADSTAKACSPDKDAESDAAACVAKDEVVVGLPGAAGVATKGAVTKGTQRFALGQEFTYATTESVVHQTGALATGNPADVIIIILLFIRAALPTHACAALCQCQSACLPVCLSLCVRLLLCTTLGTPTHACAALCQCQCACLPVCLSLCASLCTLGTPVGMVGTCSTTVLQY